jgi:hypothetical protein
MPIWLSLLEYAVSFLVWAYGHQTVLDKVLKAAPLKPDPDPPLSQQNNPNTSNPPDRGGIPR